MSRFPENGIISLVGPPPRHDLAESTGPDLRLGTLLGPNEIDDLPLAYGPAEGGAKLRAAIAKAHGVSAEEVVVTVGGTHALFLLAFILCDPGSEAVIAEPCFPIATGSLRAVGTRLRTLRLSFDDQYRLDAESLAAVLSPKTRIVSLATPQNPSGVSIAADTIQAALDRMKRICPEAFLLIDETYREAAYGTAPIAPSAATLSRKVISIASLSKCHGAPGLRIGWAIVRDCDLRKQMIVGKFNTVISCSSVDEALALRVFERREVIVSDRRVHLQENLQRAKAWVCANPELIEWVEPDAGAICCVRLRRNVYSDASVDGFYRHVAEKGARVANGTWFGDEARVFRLGFGLLQASELDEALAAVTSALHQVAKESLPAVPAARVLIPSPC